MSKFNAINRVEFLAKEFRVFTNEEYDRKLKLEVNGEMVPIFGDDKSYPLAIMYITKKRDKQYEGNVVMSSKITVDVGEDVFIDVIQADPTVKKIYSQWILNVFTRFLKNNDTIGAIRFIEEDLIIASEYLTVFDVNKKTNEFKKICVINSELLKISDPTNINQFRDLTQLFDIVDPFIVRDTSKLEKEMLKYVRLGEATIPVKDRNFTLYIPKTNKASYILKTYASWCTTRNKTGMVKEYTGMLRPNKSKSNLYVIIDNSLFKNDTGDLWQVHFESGQIMYKNNKQENNFYDKVLIRSEALRNYFKNELIQDAKAFNAIKSRNSTNRYLKYLEDFGNSDGLFEILSPNIMALSFTNKIISDVPDLTRFQFIKLIFLSKCRVEKIDESIVKLKNLQLLSLPNNNIDTLPPFIGDLSELVFLNIVGNKIIYISNNISKLDKTNGGKLEKMSLSVKDIGVENFEKLKLLLPTVDFEITR